MINGLYSAGSAMEASARRHELISQNLAHANMPGYRRQEMRHACMEHSFDDAYRNAVQFHSMGTTSDEILTDFTQGIMERTGEPLDVALEGAGFFVVEGPAGPLYTRNGTFHVDADGQLLTADRLPVMGRDGAITFPGDVILSQVVIDAEGRIFHGNNEIGQLDIVDFNAPQRLSRSGITLFQAPADLPPQDSTATLIQGSRERANVSPIQEFVEMIAAQRQQEAAQKSMSLMIDSLGKHINVQGRG